MTDGAMRQQVHMGRGSLSRLGAVLRELEPRRILLVTGKSLYVVSGAQSLVEEQLGSIPTTRFDEFSPNPRIEEALAGAEVYAKAGCDAILAVGGGSTIDVAKTINVIHSQPDDALDVVTGVKPVTPPIGPLVAVPTTAGTGSEATHFAVVYVEGKKYSVAHESMLPTIAVVDSRLTDHLPPYETACTGFDALCQAIESYWSKGGTAQSRALAGQAITGITSKFLGAVRAGSPAARDQMHESAHNAGEAINVTKTTAPHALSYKITSDYGVPHGHAVAITLGRFFALNDTLAQQRGDELLRARLRDLYALLGMDSAEAAERYWYALMADCALETSLGELGAREVDLDSLVDGVNLERLGNHPVPLSRDDLRSVLDQCM